MFTFLFYGLTCVHLSFAVTCYKCESVDQPAHCYQTANCQADEICMVSQNPKLNGDLFFNLGCFSKATCQFLNNHHAVGRRFLVSSPLSIAKCCDTDNCNKDLLCPGGICGTISIPTTTSIPSTTSTNTSCLDDDIPICKNSAAVSLVCRDRDLRQHCKKTCGLYPPPTTQQTMVCEDHVIDCNDQSFLSAVCGRPEAQFFCKKSCNKCCFRCYNCKNLNSVSKCFFRTSCGQDESCSLSRYPDEYGVDIYSLGCLSKSVCDMIEGINTATFGRRTVASLTRCCNTDNCNKNLLQQSTHVSQTSQVPMHQPTLKSTEIPTSSAPVIYSSSGPRTSSVPLYTTHHSTEPTVKPCLDTGTQCTQKDFQRLVCGVKEFEPLCAKSCGLCK